MEKFPYPVCVQRKTKIVNVVYDQQGEIPNKAERANQYCFAGLLCTHGTNHLTGDTPQAQACTSHGIVSKGPLVLSR